MYVQDYITQGAGGALVANGPVGEVMSGMRYDPGMLRPYFETNPNSPLRGRPCVTINTGRMVYNNALKTYVPERRKVLVRDLQERGINSPVFNATALRKEEWIELDRRVLMAARLRMRAWSDLAKANSFGGFNGMAKMILEHETMSDPGEAVVDMDGLSEGRNDAPKFQLEGLPLPITHSDFSFSQRRLAISRNSGTPLDMTMGEAAGRRVAETIEKTLIGVTTGVTYGGNSTQVGGYGRASSVYGYTNFPNRLTKTNLYGPTGVGRAGTGWVPLDTVKDVLAMRDQLYLGRFYGPFVIYHSNDWDQYMDQDYTLTNSSGIALQTLRERLKTIEGVTDVKRLDFLFGSAPSTTASGGRDVDYDATLHPFTLVMVQMTADVCRAVNGLDLTSVQWEERGGLKLKFLVMTISVPQLRADFYGNAGIMHAYAT